MLQAIQNNFTPGKVKRIIEEEPTDQFYNKNFGKYDAVVASGLNTDSQRQIAVAQALHLREAGIPIPDKFFIDNMILQNKDELIQEMEEEKKAQQQAEQQAQQVQQQELMSRAQLSEARVQEQLAMAEERKTRSISNIGLYQERIHESHKDDTQAKLNYIKALSELEDMDLAKIEKLINMAKMIEDPPASTIPKQTNIPAKPE
jgi:hypothetical protein